MIDPLFPQNSWLGQLSLVETWIAYEGPKLFVAAGPTGQHYVCVAVEETEDSETYLYLAVSDERLVMVRSGGLSLRDALLTAESSHVYRVKFDFADGAQSTVNLDAVESLPEDWLPVEGARVEIPTDTREPFSPDELTTRAAAEARTLVALKLNPPGGMRTEYPIGPLGEVLESFQSAVNALAQEVRGEPTTRGVIPEEITRDAEYGFVDIRAASFVAIISPFRGDEIFEMPLVREATIKLMDVMKSTEDASKLERTVASLGARSVSKLKEILEEVVDREADLGIYFAAPNEELREVSVTPTTAAASIGVIDRADESIEEIVIERAMLVGVNVRTRAFEIQDVEEGQKYSGRLDSAVVAQVQGLTIGGDARYRAWIMRERTFVNYSAEPTTKDRLVGIELL